MSTNGGDQGGADIKNLWDRAPLCYFSLGCSIGWQQELGLAGEFGGEETFTGKMMLIEGRKDPLTLADSPAQLPAQS